MTENDKKGIKELIEMHSIGFLFHFERDNFLGHFFWIFVTWLSIVFAVVYSLF